MADYAEMMGISRVSLNKAVMREFGLSAVHLLKQRLLQEVKNNLLFSNLSVKEIAFRLHFSSLGDETVNRRGLSLSRIFVHT